MVRNVRTKGSRLWSALRAVLHFLGEGLIWIGASFSLDAAVAAEASDFVRRAGSPAQLGDVREHPDQLAMIPLSMAERAEWAALVERLS